MIMMMITAKRGVAKKTSVSSQLHLAQPGRQQGRTCGRDHAPDINIIAIVVVIIIISRLSIIVILSERVRHKSLLSRLRTAVRIPIPINNTSHTFANTSNHKISIEYEYVITIIKYQQSNTNNYQIPSGFSRSSPAPQDSFSASQLPAHELDNFGILMMI